MLEAVILDFDGTIQDSFGSQFDWLVFWAKVNDKPFDFSDPESFRPLYNKILRDNNGDVQKLYDLFDLPCDMSDKTHPVWSAYVKFKGENPAPLVKNIASAIKEIWLMGQLPKDPLINIRTRISINSTNTWNNIRGPLESGGVLPYVDSQVAYETLERFGGNGEIKAMNKPSKVPVALSLGLLGSSGASTMFVGDTLPDLGSCVNVSRLGNFRRETLITVGVTWGFETRAVLEQGFKDKATGVTSYFNHIIDTPEQLVDLAKEYIQRPY